MVNSTIITKQDLERIYDSEFDRLYRYYYYRLLNKETTEDLISECFLQFATSLKKQVSVDNPVKFLYGIARNTLMNHLRQKYREEIFVPLVEDFYAEIIQTADNSPTLEDLVIPHLNQLPDKQRQVVFERLINKNTMPEIAAKLKKSVNYVKVTQHRGIQKLKQLIACTPKLTNITNAKNHSK
jgi:RNA polymerase sigma-70 factor, ECF subfamily